MNPTKLLTEEEEAFLAETIEIGVLAEEALKDRSNVEACFEDLEFLILEGRAAKDRFLLANLGLVKAIARGEIGVSPADYGEVVQEGHLALAEALARYDYRQGRFGPYAAAWIRARIRSAITTQCGRSGVPARDLSRYYAARRAEMDLMQSLGRSLSPSEIPGSIDVAAVSALIAPASIEAAISLPDVSTQEPYQPDTAHDIRRLLSTLPANDRQILKRRFGFEGSPATRHDLAGELGLSETTLRRIEVRALGMLRQGLEYLQAA